MPFFRDLEASVFHRILYRLKTLVVDKGQIILKENDFTNYMIIVQQGELEVMIEMDQAEFVLERLTRGSVINHRNFYFPEELMFMNIRATKRSSLLILSIGSLNEIVNEYQELKLVMMKAIHNIHRGENMYLIDCIPHKGAYGINTNAAKRRQMLKNVVLQVVLHNRYECKKPTLS